MDCWIESDSGISSWHRALLRVRRQPGGGGALGWAGVIKDELVGPFQSEDGLKINSQTYCQFLEDTSFKRQEEVCIFQKDSDFYAGQCSIT